jgi:UDP-N-acetylmuramyl pentapeptide phosphotransferase/UDP-N-acetylglucosamine-1-phosphate transferase
MKSYTIIGIILIVVAVAAFAYQGISVTTREKVVDVGPLQMTAEKTRTLPLTPVAGGIALVGGIALLVVGLKKS